MAHERFGVEVACYALMTNHFHLVLHCPTGGLSKAMHIVDGVYARQFNARYGLEGPLFTGRFRKEDITTDAQLLQVSRYVHRNPIDLRLDVPLADYQWSSLGVYVGKRSCPPWLRPRVITEMMDGDAGRYLLYVETPMLSDKRDIDEPSTIGTGPHAVDLRPDPLEDLVLLVADSCALDITTPAVPGTRCSADGGDGPAIGLDGGGSCDFRTGVGSDGARTNVDHTSPGGSRGDGARRFLRRSAVQRSHRARFTHCGLITHP